MCEVSELLAVYHLQKVSRKTVWKVNGTELFVSFQWKIPGSYGTSETVVCFPGRSVPNGKSCFICSNPYLIQVSYFLGPFFGKRNWLVQMETQFQNEIYQPWIFLPGFPNPYCSENITLSTTEILYGYKPESTLFRAFNHYLLIALYYIHLARNKSEDPRLDVFIVLLEIKIQCEREIAMKTEKPHQMQKQVDSFVYFWYALWLVWAFFVGAFSFIYLACFTVVCSLAVFNVRFP